MKFQIALATIILAIIAVSWAAEVDDREELATAEQFYVGYDPYGYGGYRGFGGPYGYGGYGRFGRGFY